MERTRLKKELVMYFIFGVLTTAVNFIIYSVLVWAKADYRIATTIAFIVAVVFAFYTNRVFVFEHREQGLFDEFVRFIAGRIGTYFLDIAALIILIERFSTDEYISKIISSALVIVANYFISKIWVFK